MMTIMLPLSPLWLYTIVAVLAGLVLIVTDRPEGSFIPMPGIRALFGMLLWVSVPFVWLGHWLGVE